MEPPNPSGQWVVSKGPCGQPCRQSQVLSRRSQCVTWRNELETALGNGNAFRFTPQSVCVCILTNACIIFCDFKLTAIHMYIYIYSISSSDRRSKHLRFFGDRPLATSLTISSFLITAWRSAQFFALLQPWQRRETSVTVPLGTPSPVGPVDMISAGQTTTVISFPPIPKYSRWLGSQFMNRSPGRGKPGWKGVASFKWLVSEYHGAWLVRLDEKNHCNLE